MEPQSYVALTRGMLWLVLKVSAPVVGAAALAGLIVGILQAVTQIHDASIAFAARLTVIALLLFWLSPWACAELMAFGQSALGSISYAGRLTR